jgi:flavodoxin
VKALLVVFSYHHRNTEKIAKVMAPVLDAPIKTPRETDPEELQDYDLVGFGSGIYSAKHHRALLDLAAALPQVTDKKAFIFSTSSDLEPMAKHHAPLKTILQSKGYAIVDEFTCAGFNTNSFSRFFGGINKGRPNAEDLKNAEEFAERLKRTASTAPSGAKVTSDDN